MKKILLSLLLILLLFSNSFCGITEGGSIGQLFVGLKEGSGTVQPLSPTSVRLKWVKPVGYSSFTIYAGTETEELTSRGTTRLSSFTLSNLEANSNYRFAVEGIKEGAATTDGKNYIVNFKTWADFAGVYSVNTISSTAIQIIWNYEAEDSMTYEVFIEEGEDAPNLLEEPYTIIQDTQLNISDLAPSKKYNIIVRAIYPSGDRDNNVKMESTTTDSSIDPMPVVIFDEVVLGRRPSFKVLNIIEGVVVYLLHNEYTNTAGEVTDMGDVLVAGPIASNGVNQMNNSYSEFKPGTHKIKVRVKSSEEDLIKPQALEFRVKGLLEEDWKIVDTDYALPQGLGRGSYLTINQYLSPSYYPRSVSWGKVLAAGDYNGDFIEDLAVGFPFATRDKVNDYFSYSKGFVIVFYGVDGQGLKTNVEPSLNPIDPSDPVIVDSNYEDDKGASYQDYYFGFSMHGGQYTIAKDAQQNRIRTGDINGDGISDLIVGSPVSYYYNQISGGGWAYNIGATYIFYGSFGSGITPNAGFVVDGNDTCSGGVCQNLLLRSPGRTRLDATNDYHYFGANVVHLGDINADGFGDIAISAPYMSSNLTTGFNGDNKYLGLGEVYVYYGSETGLVVKNGSNPANLRISRRGIYSAACQAGTAPCVGYNLNSTEPDKAITSEAAENFDVFGGSIAGGLNLMGDSKPELVISAPYIGGSTSSSSGVGKIYVFYGHEAGLGAVGKGFDNVLKITVPTGFSSGTVNNLGKTISLIPDVNNDGFAELVSSVGYNSTILKGSRKEGVIVYHGKSDGVWGEADGVADGVNCHDEFNSTYDNFSYNENACKGTGVNVKCCPLYLDLSACSTGTVNNNEDTTYWSGNMDPVVNITGADFNNDGYGDFALGRPWTDSISGITPAYQNSGSACMFLSNGASGTGVGTIPQYTFYDSAANMTGLNFGTGIGTGDFTGDGKDDLAVGIPKADVSGIDLNGKIGLYYSEDGWSSLRSVASSYIQGYYTSPLTSYEQIPLHVGDVNGDGYGDLVVRIRYFYDGTRYYGFVILHGSERGLVMDKEAVSQPDEATDPQIVVPYRDINFTSATDMCFNLVPIGDINRDGYDDIYCSDTGGYYGLVFFGLASGGVDISTSATTYVNRLANSVEPQLFYSRTGGNSRGYYYFQSFMYNGVDYQKGLGDFNGDGYGDVAFSNLNYFAYSVTSKGNVWIAYGSDKGLQDPSGTSLILTPYKLLTNYTTAGLREGAYCYTDHVSMESGTNPDSVCNRSTNVCNIQQLAGYDKLKINAGVCSPGAELATPDGFEITNSRAQYFGYSLTTMDYNSDGYDDLIVGAPYIYETVAGADRQYAGRVYKYKGSSGGLKYDGYISFKDAFEWNTSLNYSVASPGHYNQFGAIVNNAGDVNGDGADDLLISASGGKSYWGVNFLVYGSPIDNALQINTNASTFDEKYILNDNNSCVDGTCKILVFYQPMSSSSYCNRVLGVGDVNGVTEPHYDDVLVNCYQKSIHNGSFINGSWGTGESFLYTGGPNGLVVKGLNNQPSYSNKPVCIDGVCTPYNFYPKNISVSKLYRQYGAIFSQPSRVLNNDFNNDGFMDFIVPVNYTSKFGGSSMVGGFFIFY